MASNLHIRMIESNDLPMIEAWAKAHGARLCPNILPRLGVLAIDKDGPCAALWLHMDNSVGVCWPENAITRPGLRPKATKAAFAIILGFLEMEARRLDYGVMICHTLPAIARVIESLGFTRDNQGLVKLIKLL